MTPWKGILAATITPFHEDRSINFEALAAHFRRLDDAGCSALVVNAVTGEGASLRPSERADIVRCALDVVGDPAKVIATVGSVADYETIEDIRNAEKAGVGGLMVVAPFFYRISTRERVDYFKRMGSVCDLPYLVYNTTYTSPMLTLDELVAIAEESPTFAGVKEGDHMQASEGVRRLSPRAAVYTSRDTYISELGFAGGSGAVTYSSTVVPELTVALWNAVAAGDHRAALELQHKLNPLALKLTARSFPSPIKAALKILKLDEGYLRTPLTEFSAAEAAELRPLLADLHPRLVEAA